MQHNIVIIAAGGKGSRIGSDTPKQYQLLNGRPVLMHSIEAFENLADRIIVVIDPTMEERWRQLCAQHTFACSHDIVHGGSTRFASVKNGLQYIHNLYSEQAELGNIAIAVHDGARPIVEEAIIRQSFELAHQGKGNVLGVRSINSVRIGTLTESQAINRDDVWLIQTPQTFPANILFKAFDQEEESSFTDEASVVEKMGYNVLIVKSSPKNIKITYPEDFAIAQFYTKN